MTPTPHDLGEETARAALRLLGSDGVRGRKSNGGFLPRAARFRGGGGTFFHFSSAAPSVFWVGPQSRESRAEQSRAESWTRSLDLAYCVSWKQRCVWAKEKKSETEAVS